MLLQLKHVPIQYPPLDRPHGTNVNVCLPLEYNALKILTHALAQLPKEAGKLAQAF